MRISVSGAEMGSSTSTAAAVITAQSTAVWPAWRLDDMAEFYVGGSGCGERSSLPAEELEPLDEQDLPASLQRDLDAYQKGLAENVSYLDCLWCELYGSINSAQWSGEVSEDQARCLREKYLF